MLALLWKDLQAHGRTIGLVQVGVVAFLALIAGRHEARGAVDLAFTVAMPNAMLSVMAWGDWLVGREKTRGTWGWLRTLPVDDSVLLGEKYLAQLLCALPLWLLTSWLFAREVFWTTGPLMPLISSLILITFGAVTIGARLIFRDKIARLVSIGVFMIPAFIAKLAGDRPDLVQAALRFWTDGFGQPLAAAALETLYVSLFFGTLAWLRRTETPRLLE
jgi:hypothetical protein